MGVIDLWVIVLCYEFLSFVRKIYSRY